MRYILISLALFITSCALQTPPSGGPVDESPPELVKATPPQKTTNFTSDKIILEFNEYVQLNNIYDEIIISPPLIKNPKYTLKGKKVLISLKDIPLKEKTTYSVFFGNSIVDFRAGNETENFFYVFSTGNYIDSLQLTGKVVFAKNNQPASDIYVMMYEDLNDSVITKDRPVYFSKTLKDGRYTISNIREGKYRLFALKDENRNYQYDVENELIGFTENDINVSPASVNEADVRIFDEEPKKLYMESISNPFLSLIVITYSKAISTFSLESELYNETDFAYLNETRDSIMYWYSNLYAASANIFLSADDRIHDTIDIALEYLEEGDSIIGRRNSIQLFSRNSSKKNVIRSEHDLYKDMNIMFNRPVTKIDTARIKVFEDTSRKLVSPDIFILNRDPKKVGFNYLWKGNTEYEIVFQSNSVSDYLGTSNRKIIYKFITTDPDIYGQLDILFNNLTVEDSYLIQILTMKDKIIASFTDEGVKNNRLSIGKIKGGSYKIKIVDDENQNGKWDEGSFLLRKQAEKVIYFAENLNIRANWETEYELVKNNSNQLTD